MIIKSFFLDSFLEGLVWLPARILLGIPIVFSACLLSEIDLGKWGKIRAVGDGWWRSLPARALLFVPLFFVFILYSRITLERAKK